MQNVCDPKTQLQNFQQNFFIDTLTNTQIYCKQIETIKKKNY